MHVQRLKEGRDGWFRYIIIEITHDDDLFLVVNTLLEKLFKIDKKLRAWASLIILGEQITTMLLVDPVGAVWVRATRAVDLNNSEAFVLASLIECGGPAAKSSWVLRSL